MAMQGIRRQVTGRPADEKKPEPVEEEILVERTIKKDLDKLEIGDPVTIASVAKPGEAAEMIVARSGRRIGELPESKRAEYAEYMAEKRRIWAKVIELEPAENRLLIEVRVE